MQLATLSTCRTRDTDCSCDQSRLSVLCLKYFVFALQRVLLVCSGAQSVAQRRQLSFLLMWKRPQQGVVVSARDNVRPTE